MSLLAVTAAATVHLSSPAARLHSRPRRLLVFASGDDRAGAADRIVSAAAYLYPFLDGAHYGRFVLSQFPTLALPLRPLAPAARLLHASPFTPFLLFLLLYFAVVRNPNSFSRFVRFNAMQAVALDVLLILPDVLERTIPGGALVQSFDSTVFLFLLVSMVYGSGACILGMAPRIPIVADAADRQVM